MKSKYLAIALLATFLAGCAAEATTSAGQPAEKRECVRRTGSNLCS